MTIGTASDEHESQLRQKLLDCFGTELAKYPNITADHPDTADQILALFRIERSLTSFWKRMAGLFGGSLQSFERDGVDAEEILLLAVENIQMLEKIQRPRAQRMAEAIRFLVRTYADVDVSSKLKTARAALQEIASVQDPPSCACATVRNVRCIHVIARNAVAEIDRPEDDLDASAGDHTSNEA